MGLLGFISSLFGFSSSNHDDTEQKEYTKLEGTDSISVTAISEHDSKNADINVVSTVNGYIYEKSTGKYVERKGEGTKVYVIDKDKSYIDLSISHDDFCYIGGIIMHESGTSDIKEIRCIAFTSHNRAEESKKTWKSLMASSYSSVPNKESKKFVANTNNECDKTNLTRKVMIEVLRGEEDITLGATYWDGTDFLAWGTNENKYDSKTKVGHNKFREYKFIEIPKDVYESFLNANKNASRIYTMSASHDMNNCSGEHEHLKKKDTKTGKEEYTGKIKYPMPAQIFKDESYWSSSSFYYETGVKTTNGISATISAGKSVFWKTTEKRLLTSTSTIIKVNETILPEEYRAKVDNTKVVLPQIPLDFDSPKKN